MYCAKLIKKMTHWVMEPKMFIHNVPDYSTLMNANVCRQDRTTEISVTAEGTDSDGSIHSSILS